MNGKEKCKLLKKIREMIAKKNGVPYQTEECKAKGDCKGYCPKCDEELRDLNKAITEKEVKGKKKGIPKVSKKELRTNEKTSNELSERELRITLSIMEKRRGELVEKLKNLRKKSLDICGSEKNILETEIMETNMELMYLVKEYEALRKELYKYEDCLRGQIVDPSIFEENVSKTFQDECMAINEALHNCKSFDSLTTTTKEEKDEVKQGEQK